MNKRPLVTPGVLLLSTLLLMSTAFQVNYPILYFGDSNGYLYTAFSSVPSISHSHFYAFYVRHISLAFSVWIVLFAQSYALSWLMYKLVDLHIPEKWRVKKHALFIAIVGVLVFGTSLAKVSSKLMPDVFTPILFISLYMLLFKFTELKLYEKLLLGVLCVAAISFHTSHLMVLIVFFVLLMVALVKIFKEGLIAYRRSVIAFVSMISLFFVVTVTVELSMFGEYKYSRGGHVFLIAKFAEMGVLWDYLVDHPKEEIQLRYGISQMYYDTDDFLWDHGKSPMYIAYKDTLPFQEIWRNAKPEIDRINLGILTSPKYYPKILFYSVKSTGALLANYFEYEQESSNLGSDHLHHGDLLKINLPRDVVDHAKAYQSSDIFREYQHRLKGRFAFLIGVSLVTLLGFYRYNSKSVKRLWVAAVLFILSNALVCGTLSGAYARYNERCIWLLVLVALIAVIDLLYNTKDQVFAYLKSKI